MEKALKKKEKYFSDLEIRAVQFCGLQSNGPIQKNPTRGPESSHHAESSPSGPIKIANKILSLPFLSHYTTSHLDLHLGVSIGRFGSVFANFFKTEPNRLDLVTEPNRTDLVRFGFSVFSVRLIYFHHFLHFLITIMLSSFNILISNIQYPN